MADRYRGIFKGSKAEKLDAELAKLHNAYDRAVEDNDYNAQRRIAIEIMDTENRAYGMLDDAEVSV